MASRPSIPQLLLLALSFTGWLGASAPRAWSVERGAWFWYQSSDPNGAANIVGDPAREDEAIAFLRQWNVGRLYGSYSSLPTTAPAELAAWNAKLAGAGIDSYVMLSEPTLILPSQQANLASLVNTRLINFNNARSDPAERFVGIEMDLEPHTLPQWSSGSNADRRDLLLDLRDAFAAVRSQLDGGGYAGALTSAALPTWFDTSGTIGWSSSSQRDQWFVDVGQSLDEVSLMAYETSSVSTILSSTSYERTNFAGAVHVALRSKLGEEWATHGDFVAAMSAVEQQVGGIDIESYYRLRQTAPATPTGDFNADGATDGADLLAWQRGLGAVNAARGQGDSNGDGDVDGQDLAAWRFDAVGARSTITAVPETATAVQLACGLMLMSSRRFARRLGPQATRRLR